MDLEVSKDDLLLLDMILLKEMGETRVEIHHCRSHEYRVFLEDREKQLSAISARVKDALNQNES